MKIVSYKTDSKDFSHIEGKEQVMDTLGNPSENVYITVEDVDGKSVDLTYNAPDPEDEEKEGFWDYEGSSDTFDNWRSAADTYFCNLNEPNV